MGKNRPKSIARRRWWNWWVRVIGPYCFWCATHITRGTLAAGNLQATIEHVIPKIKGGETNKTNLVFACRRCNERKGSQTWSYNRGKFPRPYWQQDWPEKFPIKL